MKWYTYLALIGFMANACAMEMTPQEEPAAPQPAQQPSLTATQLYLLFRNKQQVIARAHQAGFPNTVAALSALPAPTQPVTQTPETESTQEPQE